jgi:hypothetical protein
VAAKGKAKREAKPRVDQFRWKQIELALFYADVDWVVRLSVFAEREPGWSGVLGISLSGQMARVTHEGLALLKKHDPVAAKGVEVRYAADIAYARHSVKLADNNASSMIEMQRDFEKVLAQHAQFFPGGNLAVFTKDNRVYGSTFSAAYERIASLPGEQWSSGSGSREYLIARDMGAVMGGVYNALGGELALPRLSAQAAPKAPREEVAQADDFLLYRFSGVGRGMAALLLTVEGAVNSALMLFAMFEANDPVAVFRTQWVVATHALSSLGHIRSELEGAESSVIARRMDKIFLADWCQTLLDNRKLRNHCMHYGIAPQVEDLALDKRAFGLIEASSTLTDAEARLVVVEALAHLSDFLRTWSES